MKTLKLYKQNYWITKVCNETNCKNTYAQSIDTTKCEIVQAKNKIINL